ncbi:MAG: hypothetical protein KAI67_02060 [Candidatus Pacebacteria bacterium]|nr:hypothetical protein [Candidatus Paceibacterota bacterium]
MIFIYNLGQARDVVSADAIRKELGLRTSNGEKVGAKYKGQNNVDGERSGKMSAENKGQNKGGEFINANSDGSCDNL